MDQEHKYNVTPNKLKKKLKPALVISYDLWPVNELEKDL